MKTQKWRNSPAALTLLSLFLSPGLAEAVESIPGQWVCTANAPVTQPFGGGTDRYKTWNCTCWSTTSNNRPNSLEDLNGNLNCDSNNPPALSYWNPSAHPDGPSSLLCGNTSMCVSGHPNMTTNPSNQCYAWGFGQGGAGSSCSNGTTCEDYAAGIANPIEFESWSWNYRACSPVAEPVLSPKLTLSNHVGHRNYTIGVRGNDLEIGEGGGVNDNVVPTPVAFNPKLTLKPDGKLITKDVETGAIKTNGDIRLGTGKNLILNGGSIIGLPAPQSLHSFTGTSSTGNPVNENQVMTGATSNMTCQAFLAGYGTTGVQTHLASAQCDARLIGTVPAWHFHFECRGNNWQSGHDEACSVTCRAICW